MFSAHRYAEPKQVADFKCFSAHRYAESKKNKMAGHKCKSVEIAKSK